MAEAKLRVREITRRATEIIREFEHCRRWIARARVHPSHVDERSSRDGLQKSPDKVEMANGFVTGRR